jgi:hypothetical protein
MSERAVGWLIVATAGVLMAWRAPVYLAEPSFWAEEGQFFFPFAWSRPWLDALVQRPVVYLHLYCNLATLAAAKLASGGLITLESAPRVTAWAGLAAQLVPMAIIGFGRAPEWDGTFRRVVAAALVLLVPRTGGIWLNSVTTQSYLALAAWLLVLEPPQVRGGRATAYAALITVCGLTGPAASFAAPLYVWRAWRARTPAATSQAGIMVACAVLQVVSFLSFFGASLPGRGEGFGMLVLAAIVWKRVFVASTLGLAASERFRTLVGGDTLATLVLLAGAVAVIVWLAAGLPRERRPWLPGAFVLATASLFGAIGDAPRLYAQTEANQRYFLAPAALFLLLVLAGIRREARPRSLVCAALLATALATSAPGWRAGVWWRPTWPRWADEVRTREQDPRAALRIWPLGWTTRLVPRPVPRRP